jgi:putative transcriptional regulator
MSRHHPTDDLLVEYAAGSTSASLALCLSVHLKYCPRCQATVNRLTLLGSVLFESQPGAAVPDEMFDRIMARIDSVDALAASRVRDTPVKQARRLLHSWLPSGGWQTVMWKQQWFKVYEFLLELSADGRQRLALQKINAGGRAPTHGHHGREITVVLEGGFSDEEGIYEEGISSFGTGNMNIGHVRWKTVTAFA